MQDMRKSLSDCRKHVSSLPRTKSFCFVKAVVALGCPHRDVWTLGVVFGLPNVQVRLERDI